MKTDLHIFIDDIHASAKKYVLMFWIPANLLQMVFSVFSVDFWIGNLLFEYVWVAGIHGIWTEKQNKANSKSK